MYVAFEIENSEWQTCYYYTEKKKSYLLYLFALSSGSYLECWLVATEIKGWQQLATSN